MICQTHLTQRLTRMKAAIVIVHQLNIGHLPTRFVEFVSRKLLPTKLVPIYLFMLFVINSIYPIEDPIQAKLCGRILRLDVHAHLCVRR